MTWLARPLQRFYFGLVAFLLLTLPLFAGLRYMVHQLPHSGRAGFSGWHCLGNDACIHIPHDGAFYAVWQGGFPPSDYWPLGVALLGLAAAAELVLLLRARHLRNL
jgi:hypothetical protein